MSVLLPIWDSPKKNGGFYEVRMNDSTDGVELLLCYLHSRFAPRVIDFIPVPLGGLHFKPFERRVIVALEVLKEKALRFAAEDAPRSAAFERANEALDPYKALYMGEEREGL